MKTQIIASVLMLSSGLAGAAPFAFQSQIGTSELDSSIHDGFPMAFAPVPQTQTLSSRDALYASNNIDGAVDLRFAELSTGSGLTRVSLFEVQRGSPEATAYRDYYERHPDISGQASLARQSSPEVSES